MVGLPALAFRSYPACRRRSCHCFRGIVVIIPRAWVSGSVLNTLRHDANDLLERLACALREQLRNRSIRPHRETAKATRNEVSKRSCVVQKDESYTETYTVLQVIIHNTRVY